MNFILSNRFRFVRIFVIGLFGSCIISCSHYYAYSKYENSQIRVLEGNEVDSTLVKTIEPYKNQLGKEINDIIGETGMELKKEKPESTLGNFICDVLLKEGKLIYGDSIDFAVYNYGGIRLDIINEGPVTRGKIFELLPFENFGAVVNLDGHTTMQLIQKIIDEGGWPVAGIKIQIKDNKASDILINNIPFDSTRNYKIVMNDYMANGGDNLFFIPGHQTDFLGITVRDMVINYIQKEFLNERKIYSAKEGRIIYAQ